MKLLLVVLVAIVATSAFQFTKRQTSCMLPDISSSCVDLNGQCWLGIMNNATATCRDGTFCNIPSNDTTGTCQNILGGNCNDFPAGVMCQAARQTRYAGCNPSTDICEMEAAVSAANDGCTDNADCVGGMNCTNNVCVGFDVDQACDPALGGDDCAYGLWCDSSMTCQPSSAIGSACISGNECPPGALCAGGNCVELYAGTNGQSCNGLSSLGCGPGLTCIADTCEPEITTQDFCDGPGQNCTSPQICSCINDQYRCTGGQEGISQQCLTPLRAFFTCIRTNECRNIDTPLRSAAGKASCGYRMCEYEFACSVQCSAGGCPFAGNAALITLCNTASNTGPGSTSGTGTAATSTTPSMGSSLNNWLL